MHPYSHIASLYTLNFLFICDCDFLFIYIELMEIFAGVKCLILSYVMSTDWYWFSNCHFDFQGIEMLSLGSFKTGAILLVRRKILHGWQLYSVYVSSLKLHITCLFEFDANHISLCSSGKKISWNELVVMIIVEQLMILHTKIHNICMDHPNCWVFRHFWGILLCRRFCLFTQLFISINLWLMLNAGRTFCVWHILGLFYPSDGQCC